MEEACREWNDSEGRLCGNHDNVLQLFGNKIQMATVTEVWGRGLEPEVAKVCLCFNECRILLRGFDLLTEENLNIL